MENLIDDFQKDPQKITSFLMKQESAPTITLLGPTKSGKSTIITELLDAASNKLLGHNVGESAQTTLIQLVLMLNQRFSPADVIIRCVPHKNKNSIYVMFLTETKRALIESLYSSRDELEDYLVEEKLLKNILDPKNRSYHCFDFVKDHSMLESFKKIISALISDIINVPELLSDRANRLYKERKKAKKEIKKLDIYEELIDSRFTATQQQQNLQEWFSKLKETLQNSFNGKWNHIIKNNNREVVGYICADHISKENSGIIGEIMARLYQKNSAYSLVFSEVNYITSPSASFKKYYNLFLSKTSNHNKGRRLKINIVDTMGLTQVSSEKSCISDEMDKIFQRRTDAYLFLCATSELPTIYDECISLLKEKKQKYVNKVLMICRTKADEIIRNKMIVAWRKDTGENEIKSEDDYEKYLKEAFKNFKEEMIDLNESTETEYQISNNLPIEYLCTAPDMSENMRRFLTNNELDSSKIFRILYDIMNQIDKTYAAGSYRFWLYSKDLEHRPLNIEPSGIQKNHTLYEAASAALQTYNEQQKKQYLQYVDNKITYHWNSVYSFWNKLSRGEGHETRAVVYGSFKLYMKNMIASWLRKAISMDDVLASFNISFDYLSSESADIIDKVKNNFPTQFQYLVSISWTGIVDNVAKKLSYDCLLPHIDNFFIQYQYDQAFRKSLLYFNAMFSTSNYWGNHLFDLFKTELDEILQRMYIFDEV